MACIDLYYRRFFSTTTVVCGILCFVLSVQVHAQTYDVDTVYYRGSTDTFINLVFLPDGYTTEQLPRFVADVQRVSDYVFSISPFAEYKNYFNVFAVKVPSADSGARHPGTATDVAEPVFGVSDPKNYFNSTFDYNSIHRLLFAPNQVAVNSVLVNSFPLFDQVVVLVNTPYYGGSGGVQATVSLDKKSGEILAHELGHSFGRLADEYYAGDNYAREASNMTRESDPSRVRWKNWVGTDSIGVYRHCCSGNSAQWYKPHPACKMQLLNSAFCAVCKETIVEQIHEKIGIPARNVSAVPDTFRLCRSDTMRIGMQLIKPVPNTLNVQWFINDTLVANNTDSITITAALLTEGAFTTVRSVVSDTTQLSRSNGHKQPHTYQTVWTVMYSPLQKPGAVNGKHEVCTNSSTVYSVAPVPGATQYVWTLPSGWEGSSTLPSITVVAGTAGGTISVAAANSCDTSEAQTLTVRAETAPTATITATDSSVLCRNDAITLIASEAAKYLWSTGETTKTITVSEEGSYTVTITTRLGCNATSAPFTVTKTTIDTSVTLQLVHPDSSHSVLISNATNVTYQWVRCPEMAPVPGATAREFVPEDDATYAVIITRNNCTDTSACYRGTVTDVHETPSTTGIIAYPNPATGSVTVKASGLADGTYSIAITDVTGRELTRLLTNVTGGVLDATIKLDNFSKGLYFLVLDLGITRHVLKVKKQE